MLYGILISLYIAVCFLLLIAVLLQQGKGGDMAAAFGGGGGQGAFGARQGATVLAKGSAALGALFMLGGLALAIVGQRGPGSVMSGVPTPSSQQAPAGTAPLTAEPVLTQPEAVRPDDEKGPDAPAAPPSNLKTQPAEPAPAPTPPSPQK